jgi:hypothetical protein
MSGSSSSLPPHGTEVSSSRKPPMAARDKKVGSSSRQAARPAQEDQWTVRPRVVPSGTGASESQRTAPRQAPTPREGRRSVRLPPSSFTMAPTTPTQTPCRGAGRGESRRTRHRRRAHRRWRSLAPPTAPAVITYPGWRGPRCPCFPHRRRGPRTNFGRRWGRRFSPRAGGGTSSRRRGGGPKRSSPRVSGLEARSPRAGLEAWSP